MKIRKISYFKFLSLFFAMIILVFIAGCSGSSLTEPIINSFSADPSVITAGESSTLSWSVTGATSVTIDHSIGSVALTGTTTVNPTTTTTYILTATNSIGSVIATTTITVNPVSDFITVEGDYSGFYNFPRQFFESSSLVPEDVVKVTDRIYLLVKELAGGDSPFSFAKGEYKEDVYGCTSPEGFVLGEFASPANNKGHHSWDVIAHEIGHSFWWWSNFFYTLAVPGPFLQESTAVLTAQYVYERIKQDPNNFNLPQDAIASLDAVYTEEREYQRSRYEQYINLGKPYSQDESGPNYAILTSQTLNYKWFLIGDEYGWDKRIKLTVDHTKIDSAWTFDVGVQINTATYDAFGLLIKTDSDTIIYFFREGTSHVGDKGKIVKQVYTISTESWGSRSTVYEDANDNYDSRVGGGGIIGNNIYIFFKRYNIITESGVDRGYIKSTDLTGSSWGNYTAITGGGQAYGHLVPTATPGRYLQPFYYVIADTYFIKFYETTDNGDNWAVGDTIYSGATEYTETCVIYIGSNKMIALLRDDDGDYVNQAVSSDNGVNWSVPVDTNLGTSTGVKVPCIEYDSATNTVFAIYQDRSSPYELKISNADADIIYSSPTSWGTPKVIFSSCRLGYPSIVKIGDNEYFFVSCDQISSSDTDTLCGIVLLHRLSWFPITVFLSSTHGKCVFDELTSNANRKKIAFTKADGITELYGEIEKWDDANESAIIHISRDGWEISDSADTDFYLYYDVDHADNDTYIGDIDTVAGAAVWDGNFKAVYHMVDDTTSTIKNSTSNNNDGTKTAANEPIEATVKVGKGQDFDGINDLINIGNGGDIVTDSTIEFIARLQNVSSEYTIFISKYIDADNRWYVLYDYVGGDMRSFIKKGATVLQRADCTWSPEEGTIYYLTAVIDNGTANWIYINGVSQSLNDENITGGDFSLATDTHLGEYGTEYCEVEMDEVRISTSIRNAAWIKATYNSLWDTLLTYGSEEEMLYQAVSGLINFIGDIDIVWTAPLQLDTFRRKIRLVI